jgi:Ala-tRNA(Pro) deacylase
MPTHRLKGYLDKQHIKYGIIFHEPAFTAQDTAALSHVSGKHFAKTVMLRINGEIVMAVLPASSKVHFDQLKEGLHAKTVRLATEEEFKDFFPDCEPGAQPPFGNLYDVDVLVEHILAQDDKISFNGGTHKELIQIKYKDFKRLVKPKVLTF